jgi:tetratricopeptide (TPR) repeat protein
MRSALTLSARPVRPTVCALLLVTLSGCNWISGRSANHVGQVYYAFGNYTAAAHEFHRAAIDDPANADYLHNLAASRKRQGLISAAEQNYRRAIAANPGHQPSYHGLASLLKQQGRGPEAIALMESWVGSEPYRTAPYVELAWLQRESGDVAGATHTLQRAMQVQPNNPTVLAHLGQIYQDSGQHATALAMYQRSLYSNWYQPEVHSRIAALQQPRTAVAFGAAPYAAGPTAVAVFPTPAAGIMSAEANADPAHVPLVPKLQLGNEAAGGATPKPGTAAHGTAPR